MKRTALVIANNEFNAPKLAQLVSPARDAKLLAEVLGDRKLGGFEVTTCFNRSCAAVLEEIEGLYRRKQEDDVVLLYYAGYGIRDDFGDLYYACRNTKMHRFRSSSVSASFIRSELEKCKSKRKILILDSWYCGMFDESDPHEQLGLQVNAQEAFDARGEGRTVLTASDTVYYVWENDTLIGDTGPSVFTQYIVEGLIDGSAARRGVGEISIDDLHVYVQQRITNSKESREVPQKWGDQLKGPVSISSAAVKPEDQAKLEEPPGQLPPTATVSPEAAADEASGEPEAAAEQEPTIDLQDIPSVVIEPSVGVSPPVQTPPAAPQQEPSAAEPEPEPSVEEKAAEAPAAETEEVAEAPADEPEPETVAEAPPEEREDVVIESPVAEVEEVVEEPVAEEPAAETEESPVPEAPAVEVPVPAAEDTVIELPGSEPEVPIEEVAAEAPAVEPEAPVEETPAAPVEEIEPVEVSIEAVAPPEEVIEEPVEPPIAEPIELPATATVSQEEPEKASPIVQQLQDSLLTATYSNSVGIEFVLITPGTFQMGSEEGDDDEKPVHDVTIDTPLYMGKCQVTQSQWEAVMGNNPSRFKGVDNPVETVSWEDVEEFIKRLNDMEGKAQYRLPTEAEWEYTCRGGSSSEFSFGDAITTDQCNFNGNHPYGDAPKGEYRQQTTPVGIFEPNAFGLHDMHGNVWEWTSDFYRSYAGGPGTEEEEHQSGAPRVIRGGSWHNSARSCRSAKRFIITPVYRNAILGFRLVRTID